VPSPATTRELLDRYEGVLLDIYGVILDASGLLPGAADLIRELARRDKPYAFVTNDASRSTATYAARLASLGLDVAPERFVTSGSLLPGYIHATNLVGARIGVLGTEDSMAFVRAGGGVVVPIVQGCELDALAVCDDAGFAFLDGLEWALSAVVRAVDAGRRPALVLPNPDLVYPKGGGELGFTAGTMALMIEAALARRFPAEKLAFEHLGKPQPNLFVHAATQLGLAPQQLVMIGDQLETDIAGARAAGCHAALLHGHVSRWNDAATVEPTWLLDRLWP
jgi:HAD superfamily hydrolase (TIGR01450 family)